MSETSQKEFDPTPNRPPSIGALLFALAAIAILINRPARLAMRLMTLMLAVFGVLVWVPHLVTHPQSHFNWSECVLTFLVTGATWMVSEQTSNHALQPTASRR